MTKHTLHIGIAIAILGALIVLWLYVFGWHRPYINWTPEKLASHLLVNGRNPDECWDLVVIDLFGPQAAVKRAGCIYEYAQLKKDPSICELLMPSTYGLSCVGAATVSKDVCSMGFKGVGWGSGNTSYESCQKDDLQPTLIGNQCCLIARVTIVRSENDCSSLEAHPELHDQCLDGLAFKNGTPESCDGIVNENTKAACIVRAKAIAKDPTICSGCKERVETLEELK